MKAKKLSRMTPAERREFIEMTMAETWLLARETRQLLNDYIRESQAFVAESRAGRRNLESNLNALLRAMLGRRGNGKSG